MDPGIESRMFCYSKTSNFMSTSVTGVSTSSDVKAITSFGIHQCNDGSTNTHILVRDFAWGVLRLGDTHCVMGTFSNDWQTQRKSCSGWGGWALTGTAFCSSDWLWNCQAQTHHWVMNCVNSRVQSSCPNVNVQIPMSYFQGATQIPCLTQCSHVTVQTPISNPLVNMQHHH